MNKTYLSDELLNCTDGSQPTFIREFRIITDGARRKLINNIDTRIADCESKLTKMKQEADTRCNDIKQLEKQTRHFVNEQSFAESKRKLQALNQAQELALRKIKIYENKIADLQESRRIELNHMAEAEQQKQLTRDWLNNKKTLLKTLNSGKVEQKL